jgi:hypothetical protein
MDFQPVKILAMGAFIGFAQTMLSMFKKEDWGKLDFCEYILILLKQLHLLIICLLSYIVIITCLLAVLGDLADASQFLNPVKTDRYALLLLAGYVPSKILSWLTLTKRLKLPPSGIDSVILKWRELFIENLKESLKLRLIQLHAGLVASKQVEEKLYPFYKQHRVQIAVDLGSPKASRIHPKDHAFLTRCLMAWQGYHETALMLGKTGRFFKSRPFLCPLGTLIILGVVIYLLYFFGFFYL